jgi:hypothetical protein
MPIMTQIEELIRLKRKVKWSKRLLEFNLDQPNYKLLGEKQLPSGHFPRNEEKVREEKKLATMFVNFDIGLELDP